MKFLKAFFGTLLLAGLLGAGASAAVHKVTFGDSITPTMPVINFLAYGAKGDGVTDNCSAFTTAQAQLLAAGGGTLVFPRLWNNSIAVYKFGATCPWYFPGTSYTDSKGLHGYTEPPIRITSDSGPGWSGTWFNELNNGGAEIDLEYNDADGQHPAKIDIRASGFFEIDHLTFLDKGGDHLQYIHDTNGTLRVHDNLVIGDPNQTCTGNPATNCPTQDFSTLGDAGYWASSANITSGSSTLTVGTGDAPFRSDMVGWVVNVGPTSTFYTQGTSVLSCLIATFVSATQVTLNCTATSTITNGIANYFPGDGHYSQDVGAPFQGYGTKFYGNEYMHIRRIATMGNYANGIYFEDEETSQNTGCAIADVADCAPYYFGNASTLRYGNVIRGTSVELTGYPYAVYFGPYAEKNTVDAIVAGDGGATNLGLAYFATSAIKNVVRTSGWMPANSGGITMDGPGAAQNTLYSNGSNSDPTVLPYGLTVGGTFPNNAKTTITAPLVMPNTWNAQGMGLAQLSDGGTVSSTLQGNTAMAYGSVGAIPSKNILCWGNNATGSGYSCFGGTTASIAGVTGSLAFLGNTGSLKVAFDPNGQIGTAGNIQTNGALVSWATGVNGIFGNGAGGTSSLLKLSNSSGASSSLEYTQIGSGTSTFGATCGGVTPGVFAVAGISEPATLCVNKNGDTGIGGLLSLGKPIVQKNTCIFACKVTLAAGTATWTFATAYTTTAVCSLAPEGAPTSGAVVYISAISATAVTITSTNAADTRVVDILCSGYPN